MKHNGGKGVYTLKAIPRGKAMLADSSAPVPWKPNEWQQVEIYFTTPPDTASLGLYLYVDKQTPGARFGWTISSSGSFRTNPWQSDNERDCNA